VATRVAVFGAGSWGTAFAMVLADAGCQVTMWARRQEIADDVNAGGNPGYFSGLRLPDGITATTDPAAAADGAEFSVLSVPAQTLRGNLAAWQGLAPRDTVWVSLMKGIELGSNKRMSEVVAEVTGAGPDRIAVVSGPNLAGEITRRLPAASVVACADHEVAARLQTACMTPYFRPYTNPDVLGCELGGAVKNVVALAVGIADGMHLGDNAKAALVTRGLAETTRLATAMGADPHTLAGLAGMGDLYATCSSPLSRNHTFGTNLGRGLTLEETVAATRQTAEGVTSCRAVAALAAAHDVDMPITATVVDIAHHGKPPRDALAELMGRTAKPERR
jgi:glycerol-3-phosphate dehydrogenase (NAD(P)+)